MKSAPLRLQKFLADAGVCSRRAAEAFIVRGEVWVNGTCAVLGQKIEPGIDKVVLEGKPVKAIAQPRMTLAINKPRGLVCSNEDPHNPDTIFSLLPAELRTYRFFCAGRLDKESQGLVILTTDGGLAHRLMHPSSRVIKRYHVTLKQPFPAAQLRLLLKGVVAEGGRLKVEHASLLNAMSGKSCELDIHMYHGKKREIRQLFMVLGFDVRRLCRYQIGSMRLEGIPSRGGKRLSSKAINLLFRSPGAPRSQSSHPASADSGKTPPAAIEAPHRGLPDGVE